MHFVPLMAHQVVGFRTLFRQIYAMGTIRKRGDRWRAEVCVDRRRASASFKTKTEAAAWVMRQEAEFVGNLPASTFAQACAKFAAEVSPKRKGERWERLRLRRWAESPMGLRPLQAITAAELGRWRDARLAEVSPGTVRREMGLLGDVFTIARREWGWIRQSPVPDVRKPPQPPPRRRRITDAEIAAMVAGFGLTDGLWAITSTQRTGMAFLFALETAMRAGEILGLRWPHVHMADRYVTLPRTKNGDQREVPLSARALEILKALPVTDRPCFDLNAGTRDALFRRVRNDAGMSGFTFHDTRATAIWRLSKRLDVLQLARMIGHRDINSLRHYYNETASEIARLL